MNLTSLQKSIITTQELYPQNSAYNLPYLWHLTGNINIESLKNAIELVFNQHDVYHSHIEDNHLVFESEQHFTPTIMKLSNRKITEFKSQVLHYVNTLANTPINVKKYPLEQAIIFVNTESSNECFLFLNISHMICDVYSAYQLFSEISTVYNGGRLKAPTQFNNANRDLNTSKKKRALSYFKEKIKNITSLSQKGLQTTNAPRQDLEFHIDLEKVNELINSTKKSEFEILLTFYVLFLYRLTGQNNIIAGIPIANRRTTDKRTHGCFVNNLPLITTVKEENTFNELLNQVSHELHYLLKFQTFDFVKNISQLTSKDLSFVNNSVTLYKKAINFNFDHVKCVNISLPQKSLMFPLAVEFENANNNIIVHMQLDNEFNKQITTKLFKSITVNSDCDKIVQEILYECNSEISNIIFHQENSNYLRDSNTVLRNNVLSLIKAVTLSTPNHIAISDKNSQITYIELDKISTRIANTLSKLNNKYIAVSMEPSISLITILLGILKAHKTYVPIDKYMPNKRKKVILDQLPDCPIIADYSNAIFNGHLSITPSEVQQLLLNNVFTVNKESDIAYMIFTSGSTGIPKGVKVPFSALNSLTSLINKKLKHNLNWILFHSYGFDYSIFEIFGALTTGGTLNIVPQKIRKSPDLFREFLIKNHINVLTQTPSAFISLERYDAISSNQITELEYVFIGGEDLKFHDLSQWFTKYGYDSPKIYNLYGLTEATIISTGHLVTEKDVLDKKINNIGRPIGNTEVSVLNKNGDKCLPGFIGELVLSGEAIANGYYKNPQKTQLSFNSKLNTFKTGDLVKVLNNFELQYISRIDKQVQVSGHRIELGEIENAMCCLEACTEAFATTFDFNTGDRRLVAYYKTLAADNSISENDFRKYLQSKLQSYMIPSYLIPVQSFPLNANGKIDKKKLPNPQFNKELKNASKNSPEHNNTLNIIIKIWSNVLNKPVSKDDNFFDDGGTSILISDVYYQILSSFNLSEKDFSMIDLFEYVTPKEIANFINNITNKKEH